MTNRAADTSNRETFLNHIAAKLGRDRVRDVRRPDFRRWMPAESLRTPAEDELAAILKEQCFFIHTQLIESTPGLLQQTLDDLISSYGGGPVITSGDRRFGEYGLAFPDSFVWEEQAGRENNIRHSEMANIAVIFADYALAESGTIVVESGSSQGRSLHFLPAHYIAVIERKNLVLRSTQAAAAINRRVEAGETVGSCINLISGPSNSADIEMQLVVGVHGPLRATYVLI